MADAQLAHSISAEELKEIYEFAIDLSHRAGEILLNGVDKRCANANGRGEEQEHVEKMNAVDIVTQTDIDVEAFLKDEVMKRYPGHGWIGEEGYSKSNSKEYLIGDAPTWCVDPLDGTVNYTHLFHMFCISIALCVSGMPVIGVIYAPMLNVTYSGCTGLGSWMHDARGVKRQLPLIRDPIPPLPITAPKGCIFSCEWGKDRRDVPDGNMHRKVESFVNMAVEIGGRDGKGGMVHGVRSLGSATLDLAYVATGAFDIWWEGGCWEWDVAAGICILREAGGLITTANPPADIENAAITEVKLGSRLYLAIRPAGDGENETGRQAQERVVRETWKRVRDLDYKRPGA
ncbi:inositol monophosphatase [Xylogone sp. PMI_703]|nr:inositol monophosphatase [Xylogone sp. PMI_703]